MTLKYQPRFSGNGGHGKRLVDLEDVSKADDTELKGAKSQYQRGRFTRDLGLITAGASLPMKQLKHSLPTAAVGLGLNIKGSSTERKGIKRLVAEGYKRRQHSEAVHQAAGHLRQSGLKVKVNPKHGVEKRARTYDSELNRQRRQGMYIAGGAALGGGLTVSGARELRRDMNAGRRLQGDLGDLRRQSTHISHPQAFFGQGKGAKGEFKLPVGRKAAAKQRQGTHFAEHSKPLTHAQRAAMERLPQLGQRTSRATKGKLGGGAAVLAGTGALYRHSRSRGSKRWN